MLDGDFKQRWISLTSCRNSPRCPLFVDGKLPGEKKEPSERLLIVVETILVSKNSHHHHHLAQWLVNLLRKENSTITHSKSRLMRNCCETFCAWRISMVSFDGTKGIWLKFPMFHFRFLSLAPFCRCIHVFWCWSGAKSCFSLPPEY